MRRLRQLLRDRAGATISEFAILLPVMIYLICGAVELGHMIFARMVLEGSVTEAARLATASLETSEAQRATIMRNSITSAMGAFRTAPGKSITITTRVYRDFSSAYPEPFTDANGNGRYDLGETYIDRNKNGTRDDAVPIAGSTLGGPGDVVSYTVQYPKRVLFTFVGSLMGNATDTIRLNATTVVRNEAVARRTT